MAQPAWLRHLEASILNVGINALQSRRNDAIAAIEAASAAAPGSKSQANVNAAIEHFVPVFFRPIVDAELQAAEAQALGHLSAGAPAYFDSVITALKNAQAKLAA